MGAVHFSPGARTAWHSHEGGQTLYVTEGWGLVQSRGDQVGDLRPGDVVYTPDAEEHWHGAAPDHFMTHLSITEGGPHWGAHVSDAEYHAPNTAERDGPSIVGSVVGPDAHRVTVRLVPRTGQG